MHNDLFQKYIHNLGVALASVLLVEDDVFIRSTMAAALRGANFEVRGEVSSAKEAIAAVKQFAIDVAILDLDLGPGANGIDIAHALRTSSPHIGIIILTSYSDPRIANPTSLPLPKGAKFITKSTISNLNTLTSSIVELRVAPSNQRSFNAPEKIELTENQIMVLQYVADGLATKEIARRLDISEKAVEGTITRLQNILEIPKSNSLNSRVQLARAYFELSGKKPPGV